MSSRTGETLHLLMAGMTVFGFPEERIGGLVRLMQGLTTPLAPLEFWFDFVSPYAYFAALEIDELAARHGRAVIWRPFLLGAIFKITGARALVDTPMKNDYARRDWLRIAAISGAPFVLPAQLANGLPAVRIHYHLERKSATETAAFSKAVFQGHFTAALNCGDVDQIVSLAVAHGHNEAAVRAGMMEPAVKARAIAACREASDRGIFGVPWVFVGDEPFWGWDRLPMVEDWLAGSKAANPRLSLPGEA